MNNHYNCIYMYTNKINGKRYIGKAQDFLDRKRTHISSSYNENARDYNVPFHRAIRKYGIESFETIILKENLTKDEMNYWEDYYIEQFNLYAKDGNGYNIAKGGIGGNLIKGKTEEEKRERSKKISNSWTEERKKEHSGAIKGENNPMYGKYHSEETKQKMSSNHANVTGKNNPMYGKYHTEESRQKMSKAISGKNHPKAKRVAQYDKQGKLINIWDYAKQVEKELGIDQSSITKCCKGKLKTVGGYIWRYAEEI